MIKARPTVYRGVLMRSRLEARFAAWLDSVNIEWQYEPICYGDVRGQYLPDFRLETTLYAEHDQPVVAYAEVKPAAADLDVGGVLRRMERIWSSEPDAMLILSTPHDIGYWSFPVGQHGRWVWGEWWSTLWIDAAAREAERVALNPSDIEVDWPPRYDAKPSALSELAVSPWTRAPQ